MNVDVTGALAHLDAFLEGAHKGYAHDVKLAAQARDISVAYTETRDIDVDAAASLAYLAHFGPRAITAVAHALRSLPQPEKPVRIVDVGAGSGASALAWAFAGAKDIALVERSSRATDLAARLLHGCGAQVRRHHDHIDTFRNKEVTHISAAFVVGELAHEQPEQMLEAINASACVVVVDAGDRPRARRLQALRDRLVARDAVTVHGPCPHRDPCPALIRERDWCHDRIAKALPERLASFSRLVGRDDEAMSLSWLTWSPSTPAASNDVDGDVDGDIVVIGEPRREKGRTRLPVCGPGGLRFLQALHRNKAETARLESLPRGHRLSSAGARVDGAPAGAGAL